MRKEQTLLKALALYSLVLQSAHAVYFVKVAPSDLPQIQMDGSLKVLDLAISRQLDTCRNQDQNARRSVGDRNPTRREWCIEVGERMRALIQNSKSLSELYMRARGEFDWYQSVGSDQKGLVTYTGYNSPTLRGALKEGGSFLFPVYKKPADLVQVNENGKLVWKRKKSDGSTVPYYTRKEIDKDGVLSGKGLEIAWVDDWFSVTILQVEGAGFIDARTRNGKAIKIHVNYAAANGRPYKSPRKILESQGVAAEYLTIPGMRRYFREHPEELEGVLLQNESYVFFSTDNSPPLGVDGIQLTPWHSVAIDRGIFATGLLSLISTEKPLVSTTQQDVGGWEGFTRFVVTQDTGGAIVGPGRVDVYWGEDAYAELASGTMNQHGTMYVALPKLKSN